MDEIAGALAGGADASRADDPDAIRQTLQHRHLPKLAAADLVSRTDAGVAPGEHPVLEDPRIDDLLSVEADDWDQVLRCLAHSRRRIVLSILAASDEPVDRAALAHAVARRDPETDAGDVEDVLLDLHHVQLPKLVEAELVALEDDRETVRYLGHPELGDLSRADGEGAASRREISL